MELSYRVIEVLMMLCQLTLYKRVSDDVSN